MFRHKNETFKLIKFVDNRFSAPFLTLLLKICQSRPLFVYFRLFYMTQIKYKLIKALIVCLGLEPGAAGWKAATNPQSYGGTTFLTLPTLSVLTVCFMNLFSVRSFKFDTRSPGKILRKIVFPNLDICLIILDAYFLNSIFLVVIFFYFLVLKFGNTYNPRIC